MLKSYTNYKSPSSVSVLSLVRIRTLAVAHLCCGRFDSLALLRPRKASLAKQVPPLPLVLLASSEASTASRGKQAVLATVHAPSFAQLPQEGLLR